MIERPSTDGIPCPPQISPLNFNAQEQLASMPGELMRAMAISRPSAKPATTKADLSLYLIVRLLIQVTLVVGH